jgi:hypothetical protein
LEWPRLTVIFGYALPMSVRAFLDDFRRLAFVGGLLIAVASGVWAGTYWGWWAYTWDIALPVRVVGVASISASAFVVWYGLVFTSHYYFGFPRQNPLSPSEGSVGGPEAPPIRLFTSLDENNVLFLTVTNNGPTDHFAAQISYLSGTNNFLTIPFPIRWQHVAGGTQEIVTRHGHQLQVLQLTLNNAKDGIELIEFFSPGGSDRITPSIDIFSPGNIRLYEPFHIFLEITSARNGSSMRVHLVIEASVVNQRLKVRDYQVVD